MRARPSQRIFALLGVLSSYSFIGASHPPSDSFRAIIAWLEVCPCVEQLLWLQVLTASSQGLPAPPLDVYLRYQKILLTEEEKESPEIGDLAKAFLAMEARELLPPTTNTIPDLALGQSSVNESPIKGMLAYLQDYVAVFIGWLVDT